METMARRSLQLARTKPGEESKIIAYAVSSLGDALHHLGNLKEAENTA